jgi:hypothetical protein
MNYENRQGVIYKNTFEYTFFRNIQIESTKTLLDVFIKLTFYKQSMILILFNIFFDKSNKLIISSFIEFELEEKVMLITKTIHPVLSIILLFKNLVLIRRRSYSLELIELLVI